MTFSKMTVSARRTCATFIAAAAVAAAGSASAQQAACPPGSWFCESATPATPAPAAPAPAGSLQPLPPAAPAAAPAAPAAAAPPVVVYQPGPPVVVVQGKAEKPAPYPYSPRDPDARPRREWGLNLHMQGAMIGSGKDNDAGMGGMGLGLRYRPHPVVAIEPSIDFYGGHDYNGYRRGETAFSINTLLFATPRAKVVQLYFPIGFGWAGARVRDGQTAGGDSSYSYFGMSAGIGLEFRVARHFALNTDLRGFVRGRTDQEAAARPEFVDGSRRTNTSGGGLFTLGMTFYF
ncbi:MAG: outer membrane beta-barrel protein [Myxococcales bacterium]|nr:outer membrane beta-barrel protein [Myxococcales bacterium]